MNYRLDQNCIHNNLTTTELIECMDANTKILEHFHCDLYSDFVSIVHEDERKTPTQFYWVVRECGTWLHKITNTYYDTIFMQSMVDNYSHYEVYIITHHSYYNWSIRRATDTLFEGLLNDTCEEIK